MVLSLAPVSASLVKGTIGLLVSGWPCIHPNWTQQYCWLMVDEAEVDEFGDESDELDELKWRSSSSNSNGAFLVIGLTYGSGLYSFGTPPMVIVRS